MTATPSATKNYFDQFKTQSAPPLTARLGSTDLTVSRVGFGCYRVNEFNAEHRQALIQALTSGVNLIDTSTNYGDGSAERLVGDVTQELFHTGRLRRDQIVIVSKVGYLQGRNLKNVRELQSNRETIYPDMVEYQEDCWHNISPEFLRDQISESLSRMRIEALDVLLLHNPEYYLKSGGQREKYYARIARAFQHLESECDTGRIRFYGISSNTFPDAESRSEFTSLEKVLEIANRVATDRASRGLSKKSRFAVIQLPFNAYESGAALINNNQRRSVFDFAAEHGIAVLGNRPFNAFTQDRLVRLTSFKTHDEVEVKGNLHAALGQAIELENRAPKVAMTNSPFQWAHLLRERLIDLDDLLSWRDAMNHQIAPMIRAGLKRLNDSDQPWGNDYQVVMQKFLDLVTADLENLAQQKSNILGEQLVSLAPELATSSTLSRKTLRLYHGFNALTSVLVGMRTSDYVSDTCAWELPVSPDVALETLARLQRHRN